MIIAINGNHYRLRYRDPGTLRPEDKGLWRADRVEWDRKAGRWHHVDDDDYLISDDRRIIARESGWELRREETKKNENVG